MFMENVMTTEDEERMMYYAKETWLEQREATHTLSIMKDFLIFIACLSASAYLYMEHGTRWALVLGLSGTWFCMVMYAKHEYLHKTDHLNPSRKGEPS